MTHSQSELYKRLQEQLQFIKTSSELYDNGNHLESKRIATAVRVICHNTKNSTSLLNHLDLEKNMQFMNTGFPYDSRNLLTFNKLVSISIGKKAEFVPLLNNFNHEFISFQRWWDEEIIIVDNKKNWFTRKDLILSVVNKDGGAHVDATLDQPYYQLSRKNSIGWVYSNNKENLPLENIVLTSIRQIAFEVIKSFEELEKII